MIIADGTPEAVIFHLYSALRYQGPTSQPYAQRLENKKGGNYYLWFPLPSLRPSTLSHPLDQFRYFKIHSWLRGLGGGEGGGGLKQTINVIIINCLASMKMISFVLFSQSLVARHFPLSQSSWAFKIKDGDYSNGPFSRLSKRIYSFPAWLCHLRTFHTCLARNSPVTSIQLTNLPTGRWLLDLMHWNSVSSLLRTYVRSSCSKSNHFRIPQVSLSKRG